MDEEQFDTVLRSFGSMRTRRGALAVLAGLGFVAVSPAARARKKSRRRPPRQTSAANRVSTASMASTTLVEIGESDAEIVYLITAFERHGQFKGVPLWDHTNLTAIVHAGGNADPEMVAAARQAIRIWGDALAEHFDGLVTLEDVTDDQKRAVRADMRVHFIPHWGSFRWGGMAVCGDAKCNNIYVKSEWPRSSCCRDSTEGEFAITPEIVGRITVHELGHALGLGHASPIESTNDIMGYAFAPWFHQPALDPVISPCNLRALDEVYAWRVNRTTPQRPAAIGIDCENLEPF